MSNQNFNLQVERATQVEDDQEIGIISFQFNIHNNIVEDGAVRNESIANDSVDDGARSVEDGAFGFDPIADNSIGDGARSVENGANNSVSDGARSVEDGAFGFDPIANNSVGDGARSVQANDPDEDLRVIPFGWVNDEMSDDEAEMDQLIEFIHRLRPVSEVEDEENDHLLFITRLYNRNLERLQRRHLRTEELNNELTSTMQRAESNEDTCQNNKPVCPICLMDLRNEASQLFTMECGHIAHFQCLNVYYRTKKKECCVCREPIKMHCGIKTFFSYE